MAPFHRLKRSDTVNSKNGTQNNKNRPNRHDLANMTFGYSNLNPMSRGSHFPLDNNEVHKSRTVSPMTHVPAEEEKTSKRSSRANSLTTTPLGLPDVPSHVTIPSHVHATTEPMEPFSPVTPSPLDVERHSNPATGAYRDLVTGAVVETDQEGNQAAPTVHPSISSPIHQSAPGGLPVISLSNIEMPGLAAAANFLPHEHESESAEEAERRRSMGLLSDTSMDGYTPWPKNLTTRITGFAVASSKRNEDFHALFPSVPEDDYLIESYSCAVSRDLLIQGRLYVSESHLCFHSNILGWVTSIMVPFSDVVSIEKRNTAYLIPNAIIVKTLQNRYTFSSLVSRDLTYSMLVNIWRLSMPSSGTQQLADLDATDESDAESPASDPDQAKEETAADTSMQETSMEDSSKSKRSKLTKREKLRNRLHAARLNAKKKEHQENEAYADNDSDDELDHDDGQEHPVTTCDCDAKGAHLKEVVMDEVFDATPHQLFDLMFVSDFLERFFVENQHLQEVDVGEWNSEDKITEEADAARKVHYVKPLNGPIGPKQTRCLITDEQLHIDFNKFCTTLTTTRTPDVPSGNNFAVLTRMCFTWAENRRVRLYVTCSVEWSGRSMIKSIVDKASIDGQRDYFRDLGQMVREHISDHPEVYGASKSVQSKETKQAAEKEAVEQYTGAAPRPQTSGSWGPLDAVARALDLRPSVLILGTLIIILLILNICVSLHGSSRKVRDPANPHHLLTRSAYSSRPLKIQHVDVVLDEEVQSVLDALAASRRMTESLEEDIRKLQNFIQKQTNEQRALSS
ncbi:hypothetical protein MEQU1_001067 [Malassezia equina]|uniref:VASt domain-containing protein n=1 Tax=Malassezia equina TaxID=1381935 RepID=A0AAF0EHE8_9BASI|nr:hypothetical protein MEQU1_001067 [Malassezia equina]